MAAQNNERPFNPTDQALIEHYLLNIVRGNPPPTDDVLINIADVYGDCGTWEKLFEFLEKDTLYFFKRLTPQPGNGNRICRVATEGTWKGQHPPRDIYDDDGEIIGSNGNFSFIPKKGCPVSSRWVMHEFRFHSEGRYADIDNLAALCRIRKMKSKNGSSAADANGNGSIAADANGNGRAADSGPPDDEDMSQWIMELENSIMGGPEPGPEPGPNNEDMNLIFISLEGEVGPIGVISSSTDEISFMDTMWDSVNLYP